MLFIISDQDNALLCPGHCCIEEVSVVEEPGSGQKRDDYRRIFTPLRLMDRDRVCKLELIKI